jgi:hypothetical protein
VFLVAIFFNRLYEVGREAGRRGGLLGAAAR